MKKCTSIAELLAKRSKNMAERSITIDLGETVVKAEILPISAVMDLADDYDTDTTKGAWELGKEMIYMSCPIFRSKEMQEVADIKGEPHNIVEQVLTPQEIQTLLTELNKHYGTDTAVADVKKQ